MLIAVVTRDLTNSVSYKAQFGFGDSTMVPSVCPFRGSVGESLSEGV